MNTGFFWHVHHDVLLEWCHGYSERAEFIRKGKPAHEQELRLRLFKPVKGSLPEELIKAGQADDLAWQAYELAWQAYEQAWQASVQGQAYEQVRQAYVQARQAYDQARQAYEQALNKNESVIDTLHAGECPNCPWNGHTILPKA